MIEQMLEEQEDSEFYDETISSPYNANSARFSYDDFNSEIFFHCVFKFLKANCYISFFICLRSDKQEYFHGSNSISFYVYNPNDIRESHYLYGKIISDVNSMLKKAKKINENTFEEDYFFFDPLNDTLEEIQVFYFNLTDLKLNFEISKEYPYSPVFIQKNNKIIASLLRSKIMVVNRRLTSKKTSIINYHLTKNTVLINGLK